MANANINALYAGSLRIKIAYFVLEKFLFYKWRVTKVAHCITERVLMGRIETSTGQAFPFKRKLYFYCAAHQDVVNTHSLLFKRKK